MTRHISKPDGTLRARDGRQIGYGEFGDPDGKPVILFHGYGDSRLTRHPDDELTARLGVRLITVDRPGIGLTDPMKELTLIDRLRDIEELTESLKIDRFAVLGWSGGGPFTLAAAHEFGHHVTRVGIAGGFGPFERPGFRNLAPKEIRRVILILKAAPWMSGMLAKESAKQLEAGGHHSSMSNGQGLASSSDAALLANAQIRDNVTRGAEEAFRQGYEGVAADMLLVFRFKWGFKPEDIARPVDLWYGDEDRMTPIEVGRGLASLLPDARLRVSPGAGHLLHLRYWEDILETLIEARPAEVRVAAPWVEPVVVRPAAAEAAPAYEVARAVEEAADAQPIPVVAATAPKGEAATTAGAETEERELAAAAAPAPARKADAADVPRREVPVFVVKPVAPSVAADERARLRAAGFLIDEPEVSAEPEAVEAEAEVVAAEPEAVDAELETVEAEAEVIAAEPEAVEPEAEVVATEPEEVVQPESAAETEAAVEAPVALSEAEAPAELEPEAEVTPVEPEAEPITAEPAESPVLVTPADEVSLEAEPVAVGSAGIAEPEDAGTAAEAQPAEVDHPAAAEAAPSPESREFDRLRAAGFLVDDEAAAYLAAALGGLTTDQPDVSAGATAEAGHDAEPEEAAPIASVEAADAAATVPHSDAGDTGERLRAAGYGIEEVDETEAELASTAVEIEAEVEAEQPAPEVMTHDATATSEPEAVAAVEAEPPVASTTDTLMSPEALDEDEDERLRAAGSPAAVEESDEHGAASDIEAAEAAQEPIDGRAGATAPVDEVTEDQRRADELADRLDVFAERYAAAAPETDAEAIASEEGTSESATAQPDDTAQADDSEASEVHVDESELIVEHADEEERIAARADEAELTADHVDEMEPIAAQADETGVTAELAGEGEPTAEAVASPAVVTTHEDRDEAQSESAVATADSHGDAMAEPDPLLERLRAAGFVVLDPVSSRSR